MTSDDLAYIARVRAESGITQGAPVAGLAQPEVSSTDQIIATSRAKKTFERVKVTVNLTEQPFGFHAFRDAADKRRDQLVAARRKQLASSQDSVAAAIEKLGGKVTGRLWIANVLYVDVAAHDVPALAQIPGVESLTEATAEGGSEWNGKPLRPAFELDRAFLPDGRHDFFTGCFSSPQNVNSCHDGATGNRVDRTKPVRIAMIEAGMLNRDHVGWKTSAGGASRLIKTFSCTTSSCSEDEADGTGVPAAHGTFTTWVAAGSIEEGQDSLYPGSRTDEQLRRSGVAKEAEILYFATQNDADINVHTVELASRAQAIQRAITEKADVINMSWGFGKCNDPGMKTWSHDAGGMNAALRAAANAGVLLVKSAGNEGHSAANTCTLTYPAWRPEVLTVGGLESRDNAVTEVNDLGLMLQDPDVADMKGTSRGGAHMKLANGGEDYPFSGVDLVAPACFYYGFTPDANSGINAYKNTGMHCGTSNAAPGVAGTGALLRDAFFNLGWFLTAADAKQLLVNMIMLGDSWDPEKSPTRRSAGVSSVSGAGRLHARYASELNQTWPYTWGSNVFHMNQGDVYTFDVYFPWEEPTGVRLWKAAMTWFDTNLANASDIIFEVYDANSQADPYQRDFSTDIRKKMQLTSTRFTGTTRLKVRVFAVRTPAGGTDVYAADYFFSGSASGLNNN